jgi:hypothetical protein
MGDLERAEQIERGVLATRVRMLGLQHPETMQACYNLALTLARRGSTAEAHVLMDQVAVHGVRPDDASVPGFVVLALVYLAREAVHSRDWDAALVRANAAILAFNSMGNVERDALSDMIGSIIHEIRESLADSDKPALAYGLVSANVVAKS